MSATPCMKSRAWSPCRMTYGSTDQLRLCRRQQQEETGNASGVVKPNQGRCSMAYAPSTVATRDFAIAKTPAKARPGFFRWFIRRHDAFASAPGRSRDRALSQQRQIHRRSRARNRTPVLVDAVPLLNRKEPTRNDYASHPRADAAFAVRLHARDFIRHDAGRRVRRRTARRRRRAQEISFCRVVTAVRPTPSTTRMSRSTLPVPSALSASL